MRPVVASPDSKIVDAITSLLEKARAGEITSFVGITLNRSSKLDTILYTTESQIPKLHYGLTSAAHDLVRFGGVYKDADQDEG